MHSWATGSDIEPARCVASAPTVGRVSAPDPSADHPSAVLGTYRGGTYTRSYLVMFWLMGVTAVVLDAVLRAHWSAGGLVVLAVVAAMGVVVLVGTAQSVLDADGLRLVLTRRRLPWREVAEVVDPEPGDAELRLRTWDGTVVTAKGVPPSVGPGVTELLAALRR